VWGRGGGLGGVGGVGGGGGGGGGWGGGLGGGGAKVEAVDMSVDNSSSHNMNGTSYTTSISKYDTTWDGMAGEFIHRKIMGQREINGQTALSAGCYLFTYFLAIHSVYTYTYVCIFIYKDSCKDTIKGQTALSAGFYIQILVQILLHMHTHTHMHVFGYGYIHVLMACARVCSFPTYVWVYTCMFVCTYHTTTKISMFIYAHKFQTFCQRAKSMAPTEG